MCIVCHDKFDGRERASLMPFVEAYLSDKYKGWDKNTLVYKKW